MDRPCELPVGRGIVLQFFKTHGSIEVDFINQGTRMPNMRFSENEPISKLESFLNGVCSTVESSIGRRRQARAVHEESPISEEDSSERRKKNIGMISVKEWVIVAVVIIVCIGFAAIAIMFYLDHKFNLKRIAALKGKLPLEEAKDKATSKTPGQKAKKKSKWKKSVERETKEKGVGKKMEKKKNEKNKEKDEKEVNESLGAMMQSGEHYTHIFVKHLCDVANFCMEYEDADAVPKKELKIIIPGTIDRNIPEPNETPIPPPAIIDELRGVILPMFEQYPKVRAHSFYPGVQSLTDILVEFGCNLLAARGIITDGSPGMLELEMVTTSWVGKAFGLPSSFLRGKNSEGGGLLLTTTTEGMFTAMLAARQKKLHEILKANAAERGQEASYMNDEDSILKSMVAYGCNEIHLSFNFGCQLANIEEKLISLDMFDAMNVDELEREIIKDLNNKKIPMFINATFGSAQSCSFDKLDLITKVAKKYGIWVHVNASYAGNYLICPSYRSFIEGLENANSICINLHKCLTQSSHTTFFWTTDLKAVKESLLLSQNMLRMLHSDGSYDELATSASNRYKPLKIYLWLRLYGLEGLRAQIETIAKMTALFRKYMKEDGRLEDMTRAQDFGFIIFCCKDNKEGQTNEQTCRFCYYIIKSGKMNVVLVSPRSVNMIKMSFNREHMSEAEIEESWNVLKRLFDEWQAEESRGTVTTKWECKRLIGDGLTGMIAEPSGSTILPVRNGVMMAPINIAQKPGSLEGGVSVSATTTAVLPTVARNLKDVPTKELNSKEASAKKKSSKSYSRKKDEDTSTSSEERKEEDEVRDESTSRSESERSSSSSRRLKDDESEKDESEKPSKAMSRHEDRRPTSGPKDEIRSASSVSFKTIATEPLQKPSPIDVPEQMVTDLQHRNQEGGFVEQKQRGVQQY